MKPNVQTRPKLFAALVAVASLLFGVVTQIPIANAQPGPFTSGFFPTTSTTTQVVLTAEGGTFDSKFMSQSHFTWAGTDKNSLDAGTINYISPTVVSVTGLVGMIGGTDNQVTVKWPAQETSFTSLKVESTIAGTVSADLSGLTVPVTGAIPDSSIDAKPQYSGTVTWSPNDSPFLGGTVYTATITLTPNTGYTLSGIPANFFTVPFATSTSNAAGSGIITAVFPPTLFLTESTVTFDPNGGTGSMTPQKSNTALALTANLFTRTGFTFLNWNTVPNGSGITYANGGTYSFAADITLYAQWALIGSHIVTFDSNGGTGTMANQVTNVSTALIANTFVRSGYTFTGWNTAPGGGGTSYADGAAYDFLADVTLYAQWTLIPSHTVTFDGNGATSGMMSSQTTNIATALSSNSYFRTGYMFTGWNTAADGSGTSYANGAIYSFASDVTLYAQWLPNTAYTVTFNGNGSDGGSTAPQTANVPTALTSNGFTRTGYTFVHWNTASNGTGTTYANLATYNFTSDVTLYAEWAVVPTHTVTFDGNGSTGGATTAQTSNVSTLLTSNGFTRTGYTFTNWNTAANGSGTAFANNQVYDFLLDLTLYAQWAVNPSYTVTFLGNGSDGGSTAPQTANTSTALTGNGFTRTGYTFGNWNTAANGTGTVIANASIYSFATDLTLYAQWVGVVYTVTFNGNGSDAGSMLQQVSDTATALSTVGFTRTGYSFTSWNTSQDGTGTAYADGAIYPFSADATLYAQWTALPNRTVTFNGNGSDGGATGAQSANVPTVLTSNGFTRSGYTFSGWNTVANGSGTAFANGATYPFAVDATLYAQWTLIPVTPPSGGGGGGGVVTSTVTFLGNGATGTVVQSSAVPAVLTANTFVRPGFTFTGWNTAANGTGTAYANGATYSFATSATLYAQWAAVTTRTVTFNGNGSDGGATAAQSASGSTALTANGFTRAGYTFTSWNTSADGTGVLYPNLALYDFASDLTLYAQWVILAYTVTFDGNGSNSGSTPSQTSSIPASLISNGFSRTGYNFAGWDTVAAGGGTSFANGASYGFGSDLTLYAQWTTAPIITATSAGQTTVLANEAKTFNVLVEGANGQLVPVAIDLPAGITGVNGSVRVIPVINAESQALGLLTIQVQVLDDFGNVIPNLLAPIVLRFINELGDYIVARSDDGLIWTPIPLITGTTLPEGVTDGYYIDANGQIIILTKGLSQFGIKAPQSTLLAGSRTSKLVIRGKTSVTATGGKGTGPLLFSSSTPTICRISTKGVVTALRLGTCRTTTIKAGDATYINTNPASKSLSVRTATGTAARPILHATGAGSRKQIYINLGSGYASQVVLLKARSLGSTTYRTIGRVTLNSAGRSTTSGVVATSSTLQVASGTKALAVIKVTGK